MKTSIACAAMFLASAAVLAQNNAPTEPDTAPMLDPAPRRDPMPAPTPMPDTPPREVPPPANPDGPIAPAEVPPASPEPGSAPAPMASPWRGTAGEAPTVRRDYPPCSRTVQDNCQQREPGMKARRSAPRGR